MSKDQVSSLSGKTVMVTGAAGYVATHCIVELMKKGADIVAVDNFVNSIKGQGKKPESLVRVKSMTEKEISFEEVDLKNIDAIRAVLKKYKIDCVLHAAALKAVGESCEAPISYYNNNVIGSINLIQAMDECDVKKIVFSSSSTVYGDPEYLPMDEKHRVGNCTNPYAKTKYVIEELIRDVCAADKKWGGMIMRYFNPIGAHPSGLIGEDPLGVPDNLMPFIAQVAVGRHPVLQVFGTDYPNTSDGTAVRGFIHIMDVASGHTVVLQDLLRSDYDGGAKIYNLGTGKGTSVLELVAAFEKASGKKIPTKLVGRRVGDIEAAYACCKKIEEELGWKAKYDVNDMCRDMWAFQSMNPMGYRKREKGKDVKSKDMKKIG